MKRMRRGIVLAFFVAILMSCLLLQASAAEVVDSGYCGGEGDGTNLRWTLTEDNVLTITGSGEMLDSSYGGIPWHENRNAIRTVKIGDGVTTIGDYAFKDCTNLIKVAFGNSVNYIGAWSFEGCTSLSEVTLPNGVTTIGWYAFNKCTSLAEIIIPNSVTTIDGYAFQYCTSLTGINLPDGVTTIGKYAFQYCTSLTEIIMPDSVATVELYAFRGCSALKKAVISSSVTELPSNIFGQCTSLEDVVIPNSVSTVGFGSFYKCTSLTTVELPRGVTTIEMIAFKGCGSLSSVTIPKSITCIEESAFEDCENLTSVYITAIAAWCGINFGGTDANPLTYAKNLYWNGQLVKDLIIPNGVTSINNYAFHNYSNLSSVKIPNSVTAIGDYAFYDCDGLSSVIIPNSVTSIGDFAFLWYNYNISPAIYFEGNAPTVKKLTDSKPSFSSKTTLYYIPGTSGWTDSEYYDAATGTWNGYKLAVWEGKEVEDGAKAKVVSISPANGTTDFGAASATNLHVGFEELTVTFNKALKTSGSFNANAVVDFSKGNIGIYRKSDDQLIWKASETATTELLVDSTQKKLVIRPTNRNVLLDFDTEYYVAMDAGFIQFADGSTSEAIQKGQWCFRTTAVKPCRLEELTDVDYLAFSSLVYKDLSKNETVKETLQNVWDSKWESTNIKYSELYDHIRNWTVLDIRKNTRNGFYAAAFTNEDDEIVIAYRGSISFTSFGENFEEWYKDWRQNDLPMILANTETEDSQFPDAMGFYRTMAATRDKTKIAVTGHSLGGGWGDIISAYSGCKGCTFNSISIIDLFYGVHPVEMAENFNGINRWNFHDHVNEKDFLAGTWELERKPYYLHESLFDVGTANHDLDSILTKDTRGLGLTDAVRHDPTEKEWLSVSYLDVSKAVLAAISAAWDDLLEELCTMDGFWLDMGSNVHDDFQGIKDSSDVLETAKDLKFARISYGGIGNDKIIGGYHNDVLVGGPDNDELNGLEGDDVYIYYKGQGMDTFLDFHGNDRICLFGFAADDVIEISAVPGDPYARILCNGTTIIQMDRSKRHTNKEGECDPVILEINKENLCTRVDITEYLTPGVSYRDPIIISCPVDIEIVDADGKVVYTVKDAEPGAFYTDYGNFYVYEEENGEFGKHLDLVEGYDVRIVGVDSGTMDVMLYETEQNTPHLVKGVAVTNATVATLEESNGNWFLSVDENGDGEVDQEIPMEDNQDETEDDRPSGSFFDLWLPAVTEAEPFRDVEASHWFYDEVVFAYEKGLMKGVSKDRFAPDTPITRAMTVTILHRMAGEPVAQPSGFMDVSPETWYAEAVAWAAENGIVKGYGNGCFAPEETVTREQLAVMLYRYAKYMGETLGTAQISAFVDGDQVSSWAKSAVGWACEEGLLNGMGNRQLEPKGQTTRAQMAAILMRLWNR